MSEIYLLKTFSEIENCFAANNQEKNIKLTVKIESNNYKKIAIAIKI
jgi:hypothetical protein